MSIKVERGGTMPLDVFWGFLLNHPNCILRAATPDAALYDDEDLHWHFDDEGQGQEIVQLIRGKQLIGELFIDTREIQYVQAVPDQENPDRGWYMFELVGGPKEDPMPLYHFLMSHGPDIETSHPAGLKH